MLVYTRQTIFSSRHVTSRLLDNLALLFLFGLRTTYTTRDHS